MPTTYTHERFGRDVLKQVPGEIAAVIEKNKNLYRLGLQGPDLFFYYKPLQKNRVSRIGGRIHEMPGKVFFMNCGKIVGEKIANESRGGEPAADGSLSSGSASAELAYVYGSICHFALDRECHEQVYEWTRLHGISHAEIEGEFDRYLLKKDGVDPVRADLVEGLYVDDAVADILLEFYREIGEEPTDVTRQEMKEGAQSFITFNHLLLAPGKLKRGLIFAVLKAAGKYEEFHGHVINYEENPACHESSLLLEQLYLSAMPKAVLLITEFLKSAEGAAAYNALYNNNYESDYDVTRLEKQAP